MTDHAPVGESSAADAGRAKRLIVEALPLAAILALAVELRLLFYQGVIHIDDLVYSHLARRMAEGVSPFAQPLPDQWAVIRIAL